LLLNDDRTRNLLAKIYASQFSSDDGIDDIARILFVDPEHLKSELEVLKDRGLITLADNRPLLTANGRKKILVVMTGGAFDIIHPGHIETLEQAKSLGDVLMVSVARDSTFERNKKRKPQHNETLRRKLVSSLRCVDDAVLGSETDIFETVDLLKPDIIALGYDQSHDEEKILEEVKRRGLSVKVVRLKSSNPDIKTTAIISQSRDALTGL
jgi:cytidyltransferase-like protein